MTITRIIVSDAVHIWKMKSGLNSLSSRNNRRSRRNRNTVGRPNRPDSLGDINRQTTNPRILLNPRTLLNLRCIRLIKVIRSRPDIIPRGTIKYLRSVQVLQA